MDPSSRYQVPVNSNYFPIYDCKMSFIDIQTNKVGYWNGHIYLSQRGNSFSINVFYSNWGFFWSVIMFIKCNNPTEIFYFIFTFTTMWYFVTNKFWVNTNSIIAAKLSKLFHFNMKIQVFKTCTILVFTTDLSTVLNTNCSTFASSSD